MGAGSQRGAYWTRRLTDSLALQNSLFNTALRQSNAIRADLDAFAGTKTTALQGMASFPPSGPVIAPYNDFFQAR